MSRSGNCLIWDYFQKNQADKIAECNICLKSLSYKTTITNLKQHLRLKHKSAFKELVSRGPWYRGKSAAARSKASCTSTLDTDSDSMEVSEIDLWCHFEQETGGRARCRHCHQSQDIGEMEKHLIKAHYEVFEDEVQFEIEGLDQEQDALQNDDSNQFTEVIYVEEKRNKSPKHGYLSAKTPKSLMSAENTSIKKYKRNNSDLSDERSFINCNSATPDQLDSFLLYIKSLLLQTSPELSMKLQMEILNVVMRAKINEAQSNTSLELSSNGGKCAEEADKVIVTETAGASDSGDS